MELTIDKLTFGPDAIARYGNIPVFVRGAVPGDRVEVEISKEFKNYWRADVVKVIKRADTYVKAPCPLFQRCGGCHWQNLPYEQQLEWKRKIVSETLEHIGGVVDIDVSPVIPCRKPLGYRNKVQHPLGLLNNAVVSGFYERKSHRIVPVEKCLLETELGSRVIAHAIRLIQKYGLAIYDEKKGTGILRHLIVKTSNAFSDAILTVVSTAEFREASGFASDIMHELPALKGVILNINRRKDNVILGDKTFCIAGEDSITERIGRLELVISSVSFFQTNSLQAEELCRTVAEFASLQGSETVLDIYSGVGTIALSLAEKAKKVVCIEENPAAVADAVKNASLNGIGNIKFLTGTAEEISDNSALPEEADLVILDPPRKGLSEKVTRWLKTMRTKITKIVYISCDIGTFSRDAKHMRSGGYKLTRLVPVDMFPQTYHIEVVGEFV